MAEYVDKKLFEELAAMDRSAVELPPYCLFDKEEGCYRVEAWRNSYRVCPVKAEIVSEQETSGQHDYFNVFLINYLLSKKAPKPTGTWISVNDLAGGPTFFRGPHAIPTSLITDAYGNDLHSLAEFCKIMGGDRLELGDLSYSFEVIGSVRLALVYWLGDDDFPPEARLLLDSSVSESLRLDALFGLLCDASTRLAQGCR